MEYLKKHVNIISGITASGKTNIMLDMMCNYVKLNFNCVYFSIAERGVLYQRFCRELTNEEFDRIIVRYLAPEEDLKDIKNCIKDYFNNGFAIDMIFIDDLTNLAFSRNGTASGALSTLIDKINTMAKSYNIAVIVSTQLCQP